MGAGSHWGMWTPFSGPPNQSLTLTSRWAMFWLCRNWMAVPISRMISAASADTEEGPVMPVRGQAAWAFHPIIPPVTAQDGNSSPATQDAHPIPPAQSSQFLLGMPQPTWTSFLRPGPPLPIPGAGWHQEALKPPSQGHGQSTSDKVLTNS